MSKFDEVYQKSMNLLGQKMKDFPWEDAKAYSCWLAQTYYFANATTRLLALASAYTDYDRYSLHNRFLDHAKEERGHEEMLINDLKSLGKKIEDIPEGFASAGLYQSQYYWIQQKSPLAFFGYIIMLEGLGATHCAGAYQRVINAHGKKAGVFLKVHSHDDIDHIEKAMKQIQEMPAHIAPMVIQNFEHSTNFYIQLLSQAQSDESSLSFRAA